MIIAYVISSSVLAVILMMSVFVTANNEYGLPFNFIVIFLPVDGSEINWLLNYVYQFLVDIFGSILFLTNFPLNLLLMNHYCWGIDVLALMVEKLDRLTQDSEADQPNRNNLIEEHLKGIVKRSYSVIEFKEAVLRISYNSVSSSNLLCSLTCSACVCSESMLVYDVKWYAMTVKQQKDTMQILIMTQNIEGFNGVFDSVSMETLQNGRPTYE